MFEHLGAYGCQGAWPQAYFDYVQTISDGRMQTEAAYPYTGHNGHCRQTDQGSSNSNAHFDWLLQLQN